MNLVPINNNAIEEIENIPSAELVIRKGKQITLERAQNDFYNFCAEYGIDATVHHNAWTDTRLGRQNISAYDFYHMIDEMKRGILNNKPKSIEAEEQKLIR